MPSKRLKGLVGTLVASALMFSSTAAVASAPAPAPQVDPWAVLTAMSGGAPAATMCGAAVAAAAAQTPAGCVLPVVDTPPPVAQTVPPPAPVPPVPPPAGLGINPLIFGLLALAAGIGIYLAVRHHGGSNSPA